MVKGQGPGWQAPAGRPATEAVQGQYKLWLEVKGQGPGCQASKVKVQGDKL